MIAPQFNTVRVLLRAPESADVQQLVAACASEDILRVLNRQRYTEDEAESYVRHSSEGWAENRRFTWLLIRDKNLLGQISLDRKDHADSAVIGYWLTPDARGNGYLTEAGKAVVSWALDPNGADLSRIIWAAYEWNESSGRLASRLGFQPVGTREAGELGWNFRGRASVMHLDRA